MSPPMANKIQVKRSTTTATPTGLANGELAFSSESTSNSLFIGDPGGSGTSFRVGGGKYPYLHQSGIPGVMTSNAVVITDANSFTTNTFTQGLTIIPSNGGGATGNNAFINAISSFSNSTQLGVVGSNNELVTSWAIKTYVDGKPFTNGQSISVNNFVITGTMTANGSNGTSGQLLASNGTTGSPYWTSVAGVDQGYQYAWTNTQSFSNTITFNGAILANTINSVSTNTTTSFASNSYNISTNFTANSTLVNAVAINIVNQVNTATIYALTSANIASAVQANSTGIFTTGTANALTVSVGTAFIANSTKVTFTGANIDATSALLRVSDAVISGNLTVSGTVTTINTQQLVVNDNIIELASNNNYAAADSVDIGFFGTANTSSTVNYSGLARIAASSNSSNPFFRLFSTTTNPNTSATISGTITSGTLQSYLAPYGVGGGFVANSSNVQITANSTLSVNITANTLTLTTPLNANSGGTGQSSYTTGDLLYASSQYVLGTVSVPGSAANGQVLQIVNNLPAYGTLDGGTF